MKMNERRARTAPARSRCPTLMLIPRGERHVMHNAGTRHHPKMGHLSDMDSITCAFQRTEKVAVARVAERNAGIPDLEAGVEVGRRGLIRPDRRAPPGLFSPAYSSPRYPS
jgi:hypothetical protein